MSRAFFPSTLEIARLRRKITISELSKRSGVSTRELRRIAAGEAEPSQESVQAIAGALSYPVAFFYAGDLEMPRMNGLELTAHVRANESTKHIPVIMITSRNTEKHRNLATAAGVDTYLNKPFSEEELLHHIQENMHA